MSTMKAEDVPVAAWTPAGLTGPMLFDLSDPQAVSALVGEVVMALEGYQSLPDDLTVDPTLGRITVTAMPRTALDAVPEHPGW